MHPQRTPFGFDSPRRDRRPAPHHRPAIALTLASLLAFATIACGDDPSAEPSLRGHGLLVGEFDSTTACAVERYRGPDTLLYSDRPYHTEHALEEARGFEFCRGARHGNAVWILEVTRRSTLLAFANAGFGLEERGWSPVDTPLHVEAAGVALDRLYTRNVAPGRFVIRQGFTRSAAIVLWDPATAQPAR